MIILQPNKKPAPAAVQPAVITVSDLFRSFGSNHVLNGFDLTLHRGEIVVVLGRSGSGKSVLIKCIIGLIAPDAGRIEVLGADISSLSQDALDQVRAKIGFLFQSNALYDSMTVRENLEFPLRRHWIQVHQAELDGLVRAVLQDVGLEHTIDMMPASLSGGMQKRIALARTLMLKPEIILYDEPTAGLDPITGREIIDLILQVRNKYGSSALIISHDMRCVRLTADRIVLLLDGVAYATGSYQELSASNDSQIQQFFNS
ncbi:ABC transporter ATP-binding protein [Paraflavitalea pollutisoli]|uniref:ABC transporter ATP-binding protein n=1 Tax=Paraflavitalea pollutisoli TaxID=3034143 RepID=UPI0023ED21F8|nr:ATP-binding cassette domain-containing protein [Paraflavitalea sp. H1-2-19X]